MDTLIEIKKKEVGEVTVFEFHGELDETNADNTFTSIKTEIGDFEDKKIIFDMSGLKYLNSKSIGYIADIYWDLEENDGDMAICNCDENVKDVLELVWIPKIIPTFDELDEALSNI